MAYWVDADQVLAAVVERPQGRAVPSDRIGNVAYAIAPRTRVVVVDAIGCAALTAKHPGIVDTDGRSDLAVGSVDLGYRPVVHVGNEGPATTKCDWAGGLSDLDVSGYRPARRRGGPLLSRPHPYSAHAGSGRVP